MSVAPTDKTFRKYRISPNTWLMVYLLTLLPVIFITKSFGLIPSLTCSLIILGSSLIAASLHPSLGAILPLAISLFSFLDPVSSLSSATDWTLTSFWTGLITPFLLLVLPLQWQKGGQNKNPLRVLIAGGAIGLGCLILVSVHGTFPRVYFWSSLAIVPALLLINSGGVDDVFETAEGQLGLCLGMVSWGVASWQWYSLLFAPDIATWLNNLLHALFALGSYFVLFFITLLSVSDNEKPEAGLRRYFFFAAFLILGVLFENLFHAMEAVIVATVLFSLSYPVMGKIESATPRSSRYPLVALSGFPALFMATLFFYAPNWLYGLHELIIFDFAIMTGFNPLWVLLIVSLLSTISGLHWVTYLCAVLVVGAIIWPYGFSNPSEVVKVVMVVGAGTLVGARRILLWPFVSAYLPLLTRRILKEQREQQKVLFQQVVAILDWGVWPDPIGVQAILDYIAQTGGAPQFECTRIQDRFLQTRIFEAQSLKDYIDLASGTTLQKPTDGLRKALRVRGQFAQLRTLANAISDLDEKQVMDFNEHHHLLRLAYEYIGPLKESYWEIYQQIPELDEERSDDFRKRLSGQKGPTQNLLNEASQQQTSAIEHRVAFLEDLRSFRNRLPVKEQNCFRVLLETSQHMNRYWREPDLQRQAEILQEAMVRLTDERREQEDSWLTIAPDDDRVIEHPNPWLPYLDAVYVHLENLSALNEFYFSWASKAIVDVLSGIQTVKDMARLNDDLVLVTDFAVGYGGFLDQALDLLGQVGREASAALAFPRGFSRNMGLQDTLDGINKLRSILSTRYQQETEELQIPLYRLSEMLLKEIHHVEVLQEDRGYKNPYLAGNPIRLNRSALFKGRRSMAQSIISMLRGGGRPTIIIYGARRMGKTSFLLQLPRLLPGNFLPVFLDMQEGGAQQNDASFMYSIARAIFRQLKVDGNLARPELTVFEAHPYTTLTPWIEDEALPLLKDRILFITIDEFELIGSAIKNEEVPLTDKVLGYLRHLMQHKENIVLLFAGVQTLDALGPDAASYFITANPIEMSYLDPQDAEELIRNPDPSAGAMPVYDDEVVTEILRVTNCQPYLIQAICSEIIRVANLSGLKRINAEIIESAIQAILISSLYFQNIWDDSGLEGQELLLLLSGGPQQIKASTKTIDRLVHRRIIHRKEDGRFAIDVPLVRKWVQQNH